MTDPYSPEALDEIREQHLTTLRATEPESNISGHPQPAEPATEQIATHEREIGNVIYAWQMRVESGWNIVGITLQGGVTLPLVTTSMATAWEAFEVAQGHANRNACQVRLATFKFDTLAAVVEPND